MCHLCGPGQWNRKLFWQVRYRLKHKQQHRVYVVAKRLVLARQTRDPGMHCQKGSRQKSKLADGCASHSPALQHTSHRPWRIHQQYQGLLPSVTHGGLACRNFLDCWSIAFATMYERLYWVDANCRRSLCCEWLPLPRLVTRRRAQEAAWQRRWRAVRLNFGLVSRNINGRKCPCMQANSLFLGTSFLAKNVLAKRIADMCMQLWFRLAWPDGWMYLL